MKTWLNQRAMAAVGSVLLLSLMATGCARYQVRMVQPANLAQPITKKGIRVEYAPLTYHLATGSDYLAIQINNPNDTPITLLGNKSYLVAPRGETHALSGAIIAPHSFVGIIVPPQPRVYRAPPPPAFGFGFGFGGPGPFYGPRGPRPYFHSGIGWYGDPFFYGPPDYYLVTPPGYWEWKTGDVRLNLSYQQSNPTNIIEHQFLFERHKVK